MGAAEHRAEASAGENRLKSLAEAETAERKGAWSPEVGSGQELPNRNIT